MMIWDIDVLQSELGRGIHDIDMARCILERECISTVQQLRQQKQRIIGCLETVLHGVVRCPSCRAILPYDHGPQYCDNICMKFDIGVY